jgi:hypothetical protein
MADDRVDGTATETPAPAAAPEPARERWSARFLFTGEGWPYLLVPLIPVAVVLELVHAGPTWVFLASALGVIPTAALMGRATEELAARSGPGIGGFRSPRRPRRSGCRRSSSA